MRLSVLPRLLALPALLPAFWLASWHIWLGAVWWLLVAGCLLFFTKVKWPVLVCAALFCLGVLLVPWSVYRYDARSTVLMEKVTKHGPQILGLEDRFALYGLNLLMSGAGWMLGFREVAWESLLLAVPGPEQRTTHSHTFPLCAPKVAAAVRTRRAQAKAGKTSWPDTRIAWTYGKPGESFRAALALNPAQLHTEKVEGGMKIDVSVPVNYPPKSTLVLLEWPMRLVIEEGLFHALEEVGWLHPYDLTWTSTLGDDEPLPAPCEAWIVRLMPS